MGNVVFLFLLVLEIAAAVYCIYSKSEQLKTKSIIRLALIIAFIILTLTSVIEWGGRWYAFAALMLLWGVSSAIKLLRKHVSTKEYKPAQTIRMAALSIFLAGFTLIPAVVFPQYNPIQTTGPFEVETSQFTYTDPNRVETYSDQDEHRSVTVQFWYPRESKGTYPLVIFSHGSFGTITSNVSLFRELASRGYVVCSIGHPYQSFYTRDTKGEIIFLDSEFAREVASEDAKTDPKQSYRYYQKWMAVRTGDINFVIEHILAQTKIPSADTVYKLVDVSKIGVMGHSLGGSAALAVGRIRSDIGAVIALEAPFMGDILGVEDGKFVWDEEVYPEPALIFYSDSSWSHLEEWPQYAANASMVAGAKPAAHSVYLQGAGHLTLTDLAFSSPFLTRLLNGHETGIDTRYCLTTINRLTLDFFDHYLKDRGVFSPKTSY